jgi:hypothetical protein
MRPLRVGAFFVLVACFLAPLVAHAYLSSFSRFMADEYCFAAAAKSKGIFPAAHHWYATWTGRFSADLVDSAMGFVGPCVTPYGTPSILTAWLLVLIIVVYQFTCSRNPGRFWLATLMASLILFSTLEVAPTVTQSIYWGQGMRSVVPPLILGLIFVALAQRARVAGDNGNVVPPYAVAGGLLTFAAGGFSETYLSMQTSLLAVLLIVQLASGASGSKSRLFSIIVAGLCGSVLAGSLVVLAPGNAFRQAYYPPSPHLFATMRIAVQSTIEFLLYPLFFPTKVAALLGVLFVSALVGARQLSADNGGMTTDGQTRTAKRLLWIVPPVTFITLLSCFVPAAYGTSGSPPGRTLIIPHFCLVCGLSVWGYLRGVAFDQVGAMAARGWRNSARHVLVWPICFLLALNALLVTYDMMKFRPILSAYASYWDDTHRTILAAKSKAAASVAVQLRGNWAGLQSPGLDDSTNWVNRCVDDYYDIHVTFRSVP